MFQTFFPMELTTEAYGKKTKHLNTSKNNIIIDGENLLIRDWEQADLS